MTDHLTDPRTSPDAAPTPPALCLFHKNCLDGRASAAVVKRFDPDCVCVPQQYGCKRPSVLGRHVYIVDFGFPLREMQRIEQEALSVTWVDHHISHQEVHQALGWGHFDLNESGASLCWKVLFPDEDMPEIIRYVRDRDLWLWELPDSRAITAALFHVSTDQDIPTFLDIPLADMLALGEELLKAQEKRIHLCVRNGIPSKSPYGLMDKKAFVFNACNDISELGERAYLRTAQGGMGADMAVMFTMRRDGRWIHSLRSDGKRVDCERIAKNRGGGGHPGAASYTADEPFFMSPDCLDWPQR